MMNQSSMDIRAKKQKRVRNRFNQLAYQLKTRHDKLTEAGCSFRMVNQLLIGMAFIDYSDTCSTTNKLIHGNFYFIVHKIFNLNV